jgi:DNA polymerase I
LEKGNYVPGIGSSTAKIAIVGEAPGFEEDKQKIPFCGPSGKLLDRLLREAGIVKDDIYFTNVIKYRPPGNDFKRIGELGISLESSIDSLRQELETLNPNVLVPLGNNALFAITGKQKISKYRGSVLLANFGNFKCVPTIHPSFLLRAEAWEKKEEGNADNEGSEISVQIVVADLAKALRESKNRELVTIPRKLEIIKSAHQLRLFLNSYEGMNEVSIDIETNKGIPTCIALAFTPYHAASVPLLSIPGRDGGINLTQVELVEVYLVLCGFFSKPNIKFIGQNFKFDHEKLITISRLIPPVPGKLAADTSLMMGVVYTEFKKNLALMASLFTNEPYWKDEGKEFNPKRDSANQLLLYNAKDAAVTLEIKQALDKELDEFGTIFHRNLKSFYYDYVNNLHDFYMDIEQEGLDIDVPRREELIGEYLSNQTRMQIELNQLVGHEINVRSPKQVKELLFDELKLPVRPNTQEDTIVALLGNHTEEGSKESKILSALLQLRQIRTNFSYLKAEYDPDGKMRTTYRITGTETGRTSTGTLGVPLRPWDSGMAFQTIPKHGPFAKSIRSIFIAPPGHLFLEADLSQAEARIVAILADDLDLLRLFDTTDVHTMTSKWIFGEKEITPDERFIGKMARHSGHYGTGKRRFMLSVNADAKKFGINVQLSEKTAGEILNIFHAKTPKIRRVFQTEVKDQVLRDRTLFTPYGRMRQFFGNLKDEELYAHIPQSTVSDHLRQAGLRIKHRITGIRICLEAHDAFLFKVPEDKVEEYAKIIKEELEREIDFSRCSLSRGKLIIPADVKVGNRYSDLKKL